MSFQSLLESAELTDNIMDTASDPYQELKGFCKANDISNDIFEESDEDSGGEGTSILSNDDTLFYEEEDSDLEREIWGHKKRSKKHPKTAGRPRGRRSVVPTKLTTEVASILGEANMQYASHQYEEAIILMKEVIKKNPTIPDPYHTLGMIYEDRKDTAKALQFFLIACILTPQDAELWKHVGNMAKEENNPAQALFCYRKACSADNSNVEALLAYSAMCLEHGKYRKAALTFKRLTVLLPQNLPLWIQVAEAYHLAGLGEQAAEALKTCIEHASADKNNENSRRIELNAVNMLADLYISLKRYQDAIEIVNALHTRNAAQDNQISVESLQVTGLPLDIAVKYGICHVFIQDIETAELMFKHLYTHSIDEYEDLFLDVADAYIATENYDEKALYVLQMVLGDGRSCDDTVYIRYAECQSRLGKLDIALDFYEKALRCQFERQHLSVKPDVMLKTMVAARNLEQPQRGIDALEKWLPEALQPPIRPYWMQRSLAEDKDIGGEEDWEDVDEEEDQNVDCLEDDPSLSVSAMENRVRLLILIEYGNLFSLKGDMDMLCNVGVPILLSSLKQTSRRLPTRAREYWKGGGKRPLPSSILKATFSIDTMDPTQCDSLSGIAARVARQTVVTQALGEKAFFDLALHVSEALTILGKHTAAVELLSDLHATHKIADPAMQFELRFQALVIALEFHEDNMAYGCARLNVDKDPTNLAYWNLFGRVIAMSGSYHWHQRFLAKILTQDSSNLAAMTLAGHRSSCRENVALTIGEMTLAHCQDPQNPLILLCLGLGFLAMSMHRTVNDRQQAVLKAFAFLQQYSHARVSSCENGNDKLDTMHVQLECWYNVGRAHQQLGLFHLAIPMYERVLRACEETEYPEEYRLCRETAYNLSLIYRQSGSDDLARYLIQRYLTLD